MTVPSTERRVEIRRRLAMAKIAASNAPDTFWHTFVEDTELLLGQVEELEGHLSVRPVIEQTIGELMDERDALQGQLDKVARIIEPRDPNWKPLSERYPEHFKRVTDEERARRNGWDEGVSLMSQRIKAVLDGESAEDYDGVIACTGCGKCSYCRKRGVTAADVLGLGGEATDA